MNHTSSASLRRYSPWLALLLCAGVLVTTITLTVFASPTAGTVGAPLPNATELGGAAPGFRGPQQCAECHPVEFHDWSATTHAKASFDPVFRKFMENAQEPGECLACHTTGYNALTGQFVMAGVTCEACHGPYRADHPGQSMQLATSEDLCGACHKSTVSEWRISQHGQAGIACLACHEMHTQKTRIAVTTDALCAGCHAQNTGNELHQTHSEQNIRCVSCHLSRPEDQQGAAISGHAKTGHSFVAGSEVCLQCHDHAPQP